MVGATRSCRTLRTWLGSGPHEEVRPCKCPFPTERETTTTVVRPAAVARSRRLSSAAAVVADIALAALAAALIVFSYQFFALDAVVAILVLVAAVAAAAARLVQAFRGRIELGLLRQPLRPDLRPHLLQFLNYALLAALILIAGALGTFTNLPLYASILDLPLSDRISGQQFTVAVQLAALALAALALVPTHRVRPVRNLAVLSFSVFLAVSLAPALAPPKAAVAIALPLQGEWAMIAGGRSAAEPPLQASARAQCPRLRPAGQRPGFRG